jgi:hypothetical protein
VFTLQRILTAPLTVKVALLFPVCVVGMIAYLGYRCGQDALREAGWLVFPHWFQITDKALDGMRTDRVPEDVLVKLLTLKDMHFDNQQLFDAKLAKVLTTKELERWRDVIVFHTAFPTDTPPPLSG